MNDLPWVKYEPQRMFMDLLGMSPWGKIAHVALFNYTLNNDGPPANDNETLRDITGCPPGDWGRTKRDLLGKGYLETANYFLHRGTIKTLNESKEIYVANQNKSLAGQKAAFRYELLPPHPETGCVSYHKTPHVTPSVTPGVLRGQKQLQEHEQEQARTSPPPKSLGTGKGSGERGGPTGPAREQDESSGTLVAHGAREIPDEDQAVVETMNAGIPEAYARYVHRGWYATGGKNGAGVVTKDWLSYVTGRWKNEQTEWHNGTHRGNRKAQPAEERPAPGAAVINWSKEHEECNRKIGSLMDRDPHMDMSKPEREELKRLKLRREELRTLLGWKT